ncbi:hypothetical protein, partial [Clostridioides difficile]|uniref:hypothetical protein n=1 Tax=Clostridioides difficile TaxID=1496 RepID=UPI0018DBFAD0
ARAPLPPELRGRDIGLSIPYFAALVELRVDGHAIAPLTRKSWETYRGRFHAWRIPAELTAGDAVDLELVVEHTWAQSA